MSRHWWNPFDGMEELTFRPVEGGFLYRAPNPWVFGRYRHYFVNAEQKAVLASAHRTMMRQTFWTIVVGAGACGPIAGGFLPSHSNAQQLAYLGVAALIGLAIGLILNALLLHRVNPIIATLTPSSERITRRDAFSTQATAFSRRYVLGFTVLSFVMLALSAARPIFDPAGRDLMAVVGIALFGFATMYWCAVYVAKCRREAS
jgi:drug/metabolite transporter (DMT)-like permease